MYNMLAFMHVFVYIQYKAIHISTFMENTQTYTHIQRLDALNIATVCGRCTLASVLGIQSIGAALTQKAGLT